MNNADAKAEAAMSNPEAQAQGICMATGHFRRDFEAFAAKSSPDFQGN